MRKFPYATLVAVALFLFVVQAASADVIYDSLSQTPINFVAVTNGSPFAQGFDVVEPGYYLDNVIIGMGDGTSGGAGSDFTLGIYDNTGTDVYGNGQGAPGNLLTTFVGSADPFTAGNYTYTPVTALVLDPNSVYYVVASTTSADAMYAWNFSGASNADVGTGLWGGTGTGGWGMGGPDEPQSMQVNADPVPEPGTLALLLMGLPMGLLWRKSKA